MVIKAPCFSRPVPILKRFKTYCWVPPWLRRSVLALRCLEGSVISSSSGVFSRANLACVCTKVAYCPIHFIFVLHWLPVKFPIHFKICTITFWTLKDNQPVYLYILLVRPKCSKYLRSTNSNRCVVPRIKTKTVSVSGPALWYCANT